jgi:hypothetical protein
MKIKSGIISAVATASLVGGVGVAAFVSGGTATTTLTAAPAAATSSNSPSSGPISLTAATPPPAAATCGIGHDGEWPDFATGVPTDFEAGAKGGVYLWHNDDGWHLRVTHINDSHQVYTGEIATEGTLTDVHAVRLEGTDHLQVGPKDHVLSFKFNNYGGVDGVDFKTGCAPSIRFGLKADGTELPTSRVEIGHAGTNPTSVPFVIERAY